MIEADRAEPLASQFLFGRNAASLDLNLLALLICRVIAGRSGVSKFEPKKFGGHILAKLTCDPERLTSEVVITHILRAGTNFHANNQGVDDRRCQEIIADYYRRNCPALNFRAPDLDKPPGQPISIGFVSANLNNHTVGKLFRGIIAELDRRRFDVSVFAAGQADDEIGRFIQANCETFQTLPSDLAGARQLIAGAALDVLFYTDIGMDPLTYFLAFSRLAPVQCVGWGHGVTTGLPTIDYFLSSVDLQEPEAAAANAHYSETLWRLNLPPVYLYPAQAITAADMPGLPFEDDRTIYCCPQALFKIHPEFDALLAEILRRDQTGVAVFIAGLPGWDEAIRARWRAAAPELDQRIYFLPRLGQAAFLALLQQADVILDTIYMSGGLSSAEALSLAKPIVTWPNTASICPHHLRLLPPNRRRGLHRRQRRGICRACRTSRHRPRVSPRPRSQDRRRP